MRRSSDGLIVAVIDADSPDVFERLYAEVQRLRVSETGSDPHTIPREVTEQNHIIDEPEVICR
jgi:hypothetical protein